MPYAKMQDIPTNLAAEWGTIRTTKSILKTKREAVEKRLKECRKKTPWYICCAEKDPEQERLEQRRRMIRQEQDRLEELGWEIRELELERPEDLTYTPAELARRLKHYRLRCTVG